MKAYLKILALILALLTVFSMTACNSNPTDTSAPTNAPVGESADKPTDPQSKPTARPTEPSVIADGIKNVIIIIGDGMGPQHIDAGQLYEGVTYDFTKWQSSVCNTDSVSSSGAGGILTDSAASATALATGSLTVNGYVGKNRSGNDLETILDLGKTLDKSVGIVTSDNLFGATPAGFSAHATDRNDFSTITATQATSDVDFLCGLNSSKYSSDLINLIEDEDYFYANSLSNKNAILSKEKVFLPISIENGSSNEVSLKEASELAIEFLSQNEEGFVLMIEQAYIDKYSHSNDTENMLKRVKSLNETVEMVTEWIGDRNDTALIITADHETGGLSVSATEDLGSSFTGGAAPFYYKWTTGDHTKTMVKIFVYGVTVNFKELSKYNKADKIKNTDVYNLMYEILMQQQ